MSTFTPAEMEVIAARVRTCLVKWRIDPKLLNNDDREFLVWLNELVVYPASTKQ